MVAAVAITRTELDAAGLRRAAGRERDAASSRRMLALVLEGQSRTAAARAVGLARLLDHMQARKDVWICRRIDLARHWVATHPNPGRGLNE